MNIDETVAAIRGEDAERSLMEIEESKIFDPRILVAVAEKLRDRNLKVRYYAQKILDTAKNSGGKTALLADLTEAMTRKDFEASMRLLPTISTLNPSASAEMLRKLSEVFPGSLDIAKRFCSVLAGIGKYRDAVHVLAGLPGQKKPTAEGSQISLMKSGLCILCGDWAKALNALDQFPPENEPGFAAARTAALLGSGSLDEAAGVFMNSVTRFRDWLDTIDAPDLKSLLPPEPEICRGRFAPPGDASLLLDIMSVAIEHLRGKNTSLRPYSPSESASILKRFQKHSVARYLAAGTLMATGCAAKELAAVSGTLLEQRLDFVTRHHQNPTGCSIPSSDNANPSPSPREAWGGCPTQGPYGLPRFGYYTMELMLSEGSCEKTLAIATRLSSIFLTCRLKPSEASLISDSFASIAATAPLGSGIREAAVLGRIKSLRLNGDPRKALEVARQNLAQSANPSNLVDQIGKIGLMTGDLEGAKQAFFDLYKNSGKLKHAKVLAQICIDSGEVSEALDYLSILSYCAWDRLNGFITSSLNHLFESHPDDEAVGRMLAKTLTRAGSFVKAARVVRIVSAGKSSPSTMKWIESLALEAGLTVRQMLLKECGTIDDLYEAVKVAGLMTPGDAAEIADEVMELSGKLFKGSDLPPELTSETDDIFFSAGSAALKESEWTNAAGFFQKVSDGDPYLKARALHLCARCFFEANLKPLALKQISKIPFDSLTHLKQESLALRYDTAVLLRNCGDSAGAANLLSMILAENIGYRDTLALYEEIEKGIRK